MRPCNQNCRRESERQSPGGSLYPNCATHTTSLLRGAFGPPPRPRGYVERLSASMPELQIEGRRERLAA